MDTTARELRRLQQRLVTIERTRHLQRRQVAPGRRHPVQRRHGRSTSTASWSAQHRTTSGQAYNGYWRIGGDSTLGGANYFTGAIDDVADLPDRAHAGPGPAAVLRLRPHDPGPDRAEPTPTASVYTTARASTGASMSRRRHRRPTFRQRNNGIYTGGVTYGAASPVAGTTDTAATFDGIDRHDRLVQQVQRPDDLLRGAVVQDDHDHRRQAHRLRQTADAATVGSYDRHVYMLRRAARLRHLHRRSPTWSRRPSRYNDGKWHYVVATQGPDGMTLYVDGQLVGTNPQTQAQAYTGYWRVGGDN